MTGSRSAEARTVHRPAKASRYELRANASRYVFPAVVARGFSRAIPILFAALLSMPVRAAASEIHGRIVDQQEGVLPGATVTLTPVPTGAPLTTVTNATGDYAIEAPPGRYRLKVELAGFKSAERLDIALTDEPVLVNFTLALAGVVITDVVTAEPPVMIGDPEPGAPLTVTRQVIDSAMLPNSQYDDVLPLMPNVVRGPDGLISVGGARADQGALVVNGVNATDPISGQPTLMLPLEAVKTMQVYSGGYPADLGRAAGGVTSVETRAGSDALQMSMNSFFPRMLFQDHSIHGVEYWEPNFGMSGPIVKERALFEAAISYRFDRNRFETLSGPQTNRFNALLWWSQVDVSVSPSQHMVASVSADPQRTDHANITAFTPAATRPAVDQGGWSAALADRITTSNGGSLDVRGAVVHSGLTVAPGGAVPYQVGHTSTSGNYFDRQDLSGDRVEVSGSYTFAVHEDHLVMFGGSFGRAALDGLDQSEPVSLLRSDGSVTRVIAFGTGGALRAATNESAAFAQDTWTPAHWMTVDAGARFDRASAAAAATISPRIMFTVKPEGASTITGSIGSFADKLPLRALAFPQLAPRTAQLFDASGSPLGPPTLYDNVLPSPLRTPRAMRWDVELNRRFDNGWLARIRYQERHGTDELIVEPLSRAGGASGSLGVLALSSTGVSSARSMETTVGYRPTREDADTSPRHMTVEWYTSYVRSRTYGDLNSFDVIEGAFREPFVQPNAQGPLAMDVPNRLLTWGLLRFPGRVTVAPFIEVRDGFPYSAIDDEWVYVGARNAHRLPWFGALDLYVNKIFSLPGRLPDARMGLKIYNLASANNARDIQRDIERADFGATYNPVPRDFSFVFELLWGRP